MQQNRLENSGLICSRKWRLKIKHIRQTQKRRGAFLTSRMRIAIPCRTQYRETLEYLITSTARIVPQSVISIVARVGWKNASRRLLKGSTTSVATRASATKATFLVKKGRKGLLCSAQNEQKAVTSSIHSAGRKVEGLGTSRMKLEIQTRASRSVKSPFLAALIIHERGSSTRARTSAVRAITASKVDEKSIIMILHSRIKLKTKKTMRFRRAESSKSRINTRTWLKSPSLLSLSRKNVTKSDSS